MSGTLGRVYGGDSDLIHIEDGKRARFGAHFAQEIDRAMRFAALGNGTRTGKEVVSQRLCPGCYMIVLFDAAITLAQNNGQSVVELGATMTAAFQRLTIDAAAGEHKLVTEEIHVIMEGKHS
ncbi:MAG: hypothetical protein E6Q97_03930 [Desulfurellales bacterium]|nr:MAG: hypothetical protein E6Q97_03930 [Desulfurellales bacterium]